MKKIQCVFISLLKLYSFLNIISTVTYIFPIFTSDLTAWVVGYCLEEGLRKNSSGRFHRGRQRGYWGRDKNHEEGHRSKREVEGYNNLAIKEEMDTVTLSAWLDINGWESIEE